MDRDCLRKNSSWANLAYLGLASELSATLTSVWISSMRASVSLFLWWHFGAFVVKMGRKGRSKSRSRESSEMEGGESGLERG